MPKRTADVSQVPRVHLLHYRAAVNRALAWDPRHTELADLETKADLEAHWALQTAGQVCADDKQVRPLGKVSVASCGVLFLTSLSTLA